MNWSLLRLPAFRALWLGRLFSWVGSGIGPVALAFAALDLGADAVQLGLVVAARSLPNLLLILFGGVLADRLPKRLIAVGSSVVSALSLAVGALLLAGGLGTLPLLAVLGALNGVGAAYFSPSTSALLRELVGDQLIRDATVLNRVSMNIGLIVGTAIGGALVAAFSSQIALAVGSLLFTSALVAFAGLPRNAIGAVRGGSFARDLLEGLAFVLRTRWLLSTLILSFLAQFVFAGAVQVLGPIAARETFGPALWGFAGAVQTLGLVVGAVVAGSLRGRLRLAVATTGTMAMALPLGVLALILLVEPLGVDPLHWFFWLSLALFAASVGLEIFTIPLDVTVQLQVPRSYLARVYASLTLASLAGMPLGEIVVGPVARLVGSSATLVGMAVLIVAASAVVGLSRRVRNADAALG
ncbi:putative multidrug-efflux transporter [Frondihabitans sp. 762G35]|uniref:MFS transporter n=1 Tax=Frondihabitans sp. 762G35 TaxID=1446794 RepID=UPI000D213B96|nr:MFS transporter [Frondihabitans sp. 762G35]ARC55923.1 putative multidrug-efflux transporter [Frondihabitans sp. 762G35]